jgi:geranylgeranyl transferase type-1 subunit beta
MTYTAVLTLVALGDDLSRLDKDAVIAGIGSLQQSNGSFRSLSSPGECDTRFLYCAAAVCHLLGDWRGMDKQKAVGYVRSCITYEGGISLVPGTCETGVTVTVRGALLKILK